jgi:hypothetical protein
MEVCEKSNGDGSAVMASEIDISRGTEQAVSNSERAFNVHQTRQ